MEDDENGEFDKPESNFQMSQAITKDAASKKHGGKNEAADCQEKMKER